MEGIMSYDKDGSVRLPVGYRFDPTDEVLVNFYLKSKVYALPLPAQIIQEFDVFQTEPWRLPGDKKLFKEGRYFFFNTKLHEFQNVDKRPSGTGEWRAVEKGKEIAIPRNNLIVGKRNTLVFWEGQGTNLNKSRWVMHEFRLASIANPSRMSFWAVYRIFQKKEARKDKGRGSNGQSSNSNNVEEAEVIDFRERNDSNSGPPSPFTP